MNNGRLTALAVCLVYTAPAWGQEAASPSPAGPGSETLPEAPAAGTASTFDDIVVTAQRRSERLEDVPISITALTGSGLTTSGVTRLEDLARVAPNVLISRTGIYSQPAIRGISTQLVGPGTENNVALYVDGFYRPFQQQLNFDFTNVSQINILKGPQGTLFGRNATGGAILIERVKPSLTSAAADVGLSYARFDDLRAWANLSTPLSENIAIGVTGYYRRSDGYIRDVDGFNTAPVRNHEVTGTVVLAPTERLEITAQVEHSQISDGLGLAATSLGRAVAAAVVPTTYIERRRNRTSLNHAVVNRVRVFSQYLKAEYDAGPVQITSLTSRAVQNAYVSFDLDWSKIFFYDQNVGERSRAFTQEIDIASNTSGPLSYVIGAFYYDSVTQARDNFVRQFPSPNFIQSTNSFAATRSLAGFVDGTYQISDRLFLTGGLRYSWERKRVANTTATGATIADVTRSFNSFTPRAVVRYELTPQSNVYASYSKGFKSGGANYVPPFNAIRPEKLTAYEVGFKTADGGLRFDTAAYYYDYKDLQVSYLVVFNGGQQPLISNAATARVFGVEAQFSGKVTPALDLRASGAYNNARYRRFPNAPANPVNPSNGLNSSSCPNPTPPPATAQCTQDLSGRQLLRAPDWTGNIGGDYTVPLGSGELIFTTNLSLTSGYAPNNNTLDAAGNLRYRQGGFALLSLQTAWALPGGHARLTVFGNNVFDKQYFIVKTGNGLGDYGVQAEPATYGVRFAYRF